MKVSPPPVVRPPTRPSRAFFDRTPRPCGCKFPLDLGNLCDTGKELFEAENDARTAYLDNRNDPAAQVAYQAARQAYDAHVGLDSTGGTQP